MPRRYPLDAFAWVLHVDTLAQFASDIYEKHIVPYFEREGLSLSQQSTDNPYLKDKIRIAILRILVQVFQTEIFPKYVKWDGVEYLLFIHRGKPYEFFHISNSFGLGRVFEDTGIIDELVKETQKRFLRERDRYEEGMVCDHPSLREVSLTSCIQEDVVITPLLLVAGASF